MADFHSTDPVILAYAAGIMDGEGTIGIRRRQGTFCLCVQIGLSMKGWPILDFFHSHFGGCLSAPFQPNPKKAIMKIWLASSEVACSALERMRPYLLSKTAQADVAIQYQQIVRARGAHRWTANDKATGRAYYLRMKELNRKGPYAGNGLRYSLASDEPLFRGLS